MNSMRIRLSKVILTGSPPTLLGAYCGCVTTVFLRSSKNPNTISYCCAILGEIGAVFCNVLLMIKYVQL